jgi:glycosyltransferase involved in cell wall biosynthesis
MSSKVSIIITCYNDGEFIEEAIKSVEDSLYNNIEIIIIDDNSSDLATQAKLQSLLSKGYNVQRLSKNQGVGNARNHGIKLAKGKYILPLDADDRLKPAYLSKAVEVFENRSNVGVVYCNVQRFGAKSSVRIAPEFKLAQLLAGNFIASCSLFRRELWEKSTGYDANMPNYEDWEFWISLAKLGAEFFHLNEVLFEYRAKASSKISKCLDPSHRAKVVSYAVNKHIDLYQNHMPEIVGYLHNIISGLELQLQEQSNYLSQQGADEVLEKLRFAEDELIRRTAYYENSFFWKLKKLFDKVKF